MLGGRKKFVLAVSERFLSELIEVLNRPKFNRYFTPADVQELISLILQRAEFVTPTVHLSLCRDPKDNILLDIAVASHANLIVSGDKDLIDDPVLKMKMRSDYGVQVLAASEFRAAISPPEGNL